MAEFSLHCSLALNQALTFKIAGRVVYIKMNLPERIDDFATLGTFRAWDLASQLRERRQAGCLRLKSGADLTLVCDDKSVRILWWNEDGRFQQFCLDESSIDRLADFCDRLTEKPSKDLHPPIFGL